MIERSAVSNFQTLCFQESDDKATVIDSFGQLLARPAKYCDDPVAALMMHLRRKLKPKSSCLCLNGALHLRQSKQVIWR